MMLVGDLGGTHTRLAIFPRRPPSPDTAVASADFASGDHADFLAILDTFRRRHPQFALTGCALAVAGPVLDGRCHTTNLPWHLDAAEIARTLGLQVAAVSLLNDLEAAALALPGMAASQFHGVQAGIPGATGNRVVIAPGTGLGMAILHWDGRRHHALASEGGHRDFGARDDREMALLNHAARRFPGHVSIERLLSGAGIGLIHEFLRTQEPGSWAPPPDVDATAAISARALAHSDPLCAQALAWYLDLLGAEAGNLALTAMARGGVTIAGGVPPKILPAFAASGFLANFLAKGRYRELLEQIPVNICLDERAPLLGALRVAREGT